MAKCQFTGKGTTFGHNVSHSKRRTNRKWKANIQKLTLVGPDGKRQKVKIATSYLRTLFKMR